MLDGKKQAELLREMDAVCNRNSDALGLNEDERQTVGQIAGELGQQAMKLGKRYSVSEVIARQQRRQTAPRGR